MTETVAAKHEKISGNETRGKKFWWHSQNLNEKGHGIVGSMWVEGRAWFHIGRVCFSPSWNLWSSFCLAEIRIGGEDEIGFSMAIPPVAFWFSIQGILPRQLRSRYDWPRYTGIRIFSWTVWFDLWNDNSGWTKQGRWHDFNFDIKNFLFGSPKYSNRVVKEEEVMISLPEGNYPATVLLERSTWKRPRWFAHSGWYATVDVKKPPAIPGKGENSWDIDDDHIFSLSTRARTVEQAIAHYIEAVLRNRRRYGGSIKWQPSIPPSPIPEN